MGYYHPAMGRTGRPPKGGTKKHIRFSALQLAQLNALRELSPYGKPDFQAIVEMAVEAYLKAELDRPGVREKVAEYTAHPKVVMLRDVSQPKGGKG